MSRSVDTFKSNFGRPVPISHFRVSIPGIDKCTEMMVQSTSFPTEKMRVIAMHYWGETQLYPAIPDSSHRWKCTIPENEQGRTFRDICKQQRLWYEPITGLMLIPNSIGQNITISLLDYNHKEITKAILVNSFIIGTDDVNLNAQSSTTALTYNVEFAYDWIRHTT